MTPNDEELFDRIDKTLAKIDARLACIAARCSGLKETVPRDNPGPEGDR